MLLYAFNAVLLCNLHRCSESSAFAYSYLGVSTQERIEAQIRNARNIHRLAFATTGNFCLEWMLKDLINRFREEPKRDFYPLAEQAVKLAGLPDPQEHVNALTVVSRVRNTLHNRGLYEGFNLEGVRYEFNDGEIVRGCASWDHVAHGIARALKSIRHLIDCVPA